MLIKWFCFPLINIAFIFLQQLWSEVETKKIVCRHEGRDRKVVSCIRNSILRLQNRKVEIVYLGNIAQVDSLFESRRTPNCPKEQYGNIPIKIDVRKNVNYSHTSNAEYTCLCELLAHVYTLTFVCARLLCVAEEWDETRGGVLTYRVPKRLEGLIEGLPPPPPRLPLFSL